MADPGSQTPTISLSGFLAGGGTYSGSGLTNVTSVSMTAHSALILQYIPPA
jgi:hypothetical protein